MFVVLQVATADSAAAAAATTTYDVSKPFSVLLILILPKSARRVEPAVANLLLPHPLAQGSIARSASTPVPPGLLAIADDVGVTAGVPQIAAELLRSGSRQGRA